MNIFVTVGMSRWPFDRLLEAVRPLCAVHNVVVQSGPSTLKLPCPMYPFLSFQEVLDRIEGSHLVITHAGNTVRLVQRKERVPIAMARESAKGEMANDHQVKFLRYEEQHGPVVALWNGSELPDLVARHMENQARLLSTRPLPQNASQQSVPATLNRLCEKWIR
jgi:UDP-N-acetylglucosamine transferase subunit ALG13